MTIAIGSVTIDSSGNETGSGLSLAIYQQTFKPSVFTIALYPTVERRKVAAQSNAVVAVNLATAIAAYAADLGGSTGWTTAYEVDFSAQANSAMANGSNTIDGKVWSMEFVGNCTSVSIVNGTGLVFVASTMSTDYNGLTRSVPILTIPFESLVPNYSATEHIVRVSAVISTTAMNVFNDAIILGAEDTTSPTSANIQVMRQFNAGAVEVAATSETASVSVGRANTVGDAAKQVLSFVLYNGLLNWEQWVGNYSAPNITLTNRRWSERLTDVPTGIFCFSFAPRLLLAQKTNGDATGALRTTFIRLKVEYRSVTP